VKERQQPLPTALPVMRSYADRQRRKKKTEMGARKWPFMKADIG
jgi:hypothetical protein